MQANEAQAVSSVIDPELAMLLERLPERVRRPIERAPDCNDLLEVVLDLGRLPEARFASRSLYLSSVEVEQADLEQVMARIGPFGGDNRAGLERTLHRISALRNRSDKVVGLTCRVGRAVGGTAQVIADMIMSGRSVLLVGRPGVGKTTMLREAARVLADEASKRVVIVDTSNEIAGDGDVPHPGIGKARRMQVAAPSEQHSVMIEAVENHMPEVIVIDEMGTEAEAAAARTIAERGVQLVATAHGNSLDNLLMNPTLADLVGGVQTVTLGDEEARRRGTRKSVLERKAPPSFDAMVEIQTWDRVAVHEEIASTVDTLLRGFPVAPEQRRLNAAGVVEHGVGEPQYLASAGRPQQYGGFGRGGGGMRRSEAPPPSRPSAFTPPARIAGVGPTGPIRDTRPLRETAAEIVGKSTRVFSYGVNRDRLLETARTLGIGAEVTATVQEADMVLTTKVHYRKRGESLQYAQEKGLPIYVLRKNSQVQMEQFLKSRSARWAGDGRQRITEAMEETEEAVVQVIDGGPSVELAPQSSYVRRLQHQLAERYNLGSASLGREPQRRVVIFHP